MAAVPPLQALRIEPGEAAPSTLARMASALNQALQGLYGALSGGLTFRDNIACQRSTLKLITGTTVATSFPITLKLDPQMPTNPLGVLVTSVRNPTNSSAAFTMAVQAFWEPIGGRQISLTYISGLSASVSYEIDLLILGG